MSDQPAEGSRRIRNRARGNDDSDDSSDSDAEVVVERKETVARAPRAKAPAARFAAPPSSSVTAPTSQQLHADPNHAATSAGSAGKGSAAGDIFAIDYDTLTYEALLELLRTVPRTVAEERMIHREQGRQQDIQQQQQLQSQRPERFHDAQGNAAPAGSSSPVTTEASDGAAADGYMYSEMLSRIFEALNRNNEGSALTERNQVPVPVLEKIGKKKTVISNFGRICDCFHRPLEDVKDFIEKELSIRGNLDSNNALILKYEIRKATDFDRVLIKYLDEYVKCNSCHRIDTTLTKDGRRMELRCNWCTATRTVTAAGSATFSAMIEKRSRQRAAMTL